MKNILVAYDFSPFARRALGLAMQGYPFGKNVQIEALHVIDEHLYESALSRRAVPREDSIRSYFEADLRRLQSELPQEGDDFLVPEIRIQRGHPYDVIVRRLEQTNAAGAMLGGQGNRSLEERFLGRTAQRVIQHSTCPTYITKIDHGVSIPAITLCAIDYSDGAKTALQITARNAQQFEQVFSTIEVIASYYVPYLENFEPNGGFSSEVDRIRNSSLEDLAAFEREVLGELQAHSRKVSIGRIQDEIIQEAEGLLAETVIVGSHGRTGLKRFLLGSVSEGLARNSSIDVLVSRPE